MRIKLKEELLEPFKRKIITKLNLTSEIVENMNKNSVAFYMEDCCKQNGAYMYSYDDYIAIDQRFFDFDSQGNVLGFKQSELEVIECKLTHELLHAASRKDGYSGIYEQKELKRVGLNEGITQMFAEDVLGYTFSEYSDAYKD